MPRKARVESETAGGQVPRHWEVSWLRHFAS